MDFKKGHKTKPYEITPFGTVTFTDGTNNDLPASEKTCKAYGFKYNKSNGVCMAYEYTSSIHKPRQSARNLQKGTANNIQRNIVNSIIGGSKNEIGGENSNTLIVGEQNEIKAGIDNTSIIGGAYGKALRRGEVLIGGGLLLGADYPNAGLHQQSFVQLSNTTTDATTTNLLTQAITYDSETPSDVLPLIEVQNNCVLGFEAHVIALCTGGSSGTAGHYKYLKLTGAVLVDNGYNTTFSQASTTVASSGTTGTATMVSVLDPYISVQVTGTANVNLQWTASVHLYEHKTLTTF